MQVKLLSGELISLPVETEEEFKEEYLYQFIPEDERPWTTIEILKHEEERCLIVNTHMLLPRLEKLLQDDEHWQALCGNPAAVPFLLLHPDKIDYSVFSRNPSTVPYLRENLDKVDWKGISFNPEATELLHLRPDLVNWKFVATYHPNARQLLDTYGIKIPVFELSLNKHITPEWVEDLPIWDQDRWPLNPWALTRPAMWPLIQKRFVDGPELWRGLRWFITVGRNPAAFPQLLGKIDLEHFRHNQTPEVSRYFLENIDKLNMTELKHSDAALIDYLEANQDKIDFRQLIRNPRAGHLIEKYLDRFDSFDLAYIVENHGAHHLIPKVIDKLPFKNDPYLLNEILALEVIVNPKVRQKLV